MLDVLLFIMVAPWVALVTVTGVLLCRTIWSEFRERDDDAS